MLKFKEFILETPYLEYGNTKDLVKKFVEPTKTAIAQNHTNSKIIGKSEEGTYHKLDDPSNGRSYYYHYVSDKPRELSVVKNNTQYIVSKGDDGDSKHNKLLMKHHAKEHGELKSYDSNSKGSKKLWMDLVKENDPEFSVYHHDGEKETKIDNAYLNKHENDIWEKRESNRKHRLILRKNV